MDSLQDWARQKAVEYVCPNSGEPTTIYEHSAVREMTVLLMRVFPETVPKLAMIAVFETLAELFQKQELSELSLRVAGATLVTHEIARLKGESVEGPEDIAWAQSVAEEIYGKKANSDHKDR